jgi:alpha-glucosidase
VLVALNLGNDAAALTFPGGGLRGTVLVSSFADREGERLTGDIDLRGDEGLVIELDKDAVVPEAV